MIWQDVQDSIVKTAIDVFGRNASYLPATATDPIVIKGIFQRDFVEAKPGQSISYSGFQTVLDIRLRDLLPATPGPGDKVTIDGIEYKVLQSRDDGGGGARLFLSK